MGFALLALWALSGVASDRTWSGLAGDKNWFNAANWSPSDSAPLAGESATITNGTILLNGSTPVLNTFSITNATLTFTNWSAALSATNVYIRNAATLTLPPAYTNNQMSNRVHVICSAVFTLDKGGTIDAAGKGYAGGGQTTDGQGPGAAVAPNYYGGGAGHGGNGGDCHGGTSGDSTTGRAGYEYDSTNAPMLPGSGGAGTSAGAGGGAVWIEAAGAAVTVNGTISANAANSASYGGGGSGGSILIQCATFAGTTNGLLGATGGNGGDGGINGAGGGGSGGRIAVIYDGGLQAAAARPAVRFAMAPGKRGNTLGTNPELTGDPGSLYLPDVLLLSEAPGNFVTNRLFGVTNWAMDHLALTNCALWFGEPGFRLTVTNDLVCAAGSVLTMSPFSELNVGGNLTLTNRGALAVYGGITNNATPAYGALVSVTGTLTVAAGSWVTPYSAWVTNGGGVRPTVTNNATAVPLFRAGSLSIAPGAGFNAYQLGFAGGWGDTDKGTGPGGATGATSFYGGGGGHGGKGGNGSNGTGGSPYDSTNAPIQPGSGGGGTRAGTGGGAIRLEVAGNASVLGTLTANGGPAYAGGYGGGGSGGGVSLMCGQFEMGTGTVLSACGGRPGDTTAKAGGGGGGGRIAVAIGLAAAERQALLNGQAVPGLYTFTNPAPSSAFVAATGALGIASSIYSGTNGTVLFLTTNKVLTILGKPVAAGLPAPQTYGSQSYPGADVWVTNSVGTPANRASGVGWSCLGWTLALTGGAQVDSGSGTQAVVQVTNNMTLTWNWTNEYQLVVASSADSNGSVNASAVNGWYTNGTVVEGIAATASNGYAFFQWTGPVAAGHETDNPLSVTMTNARSLTAVFISLAGEKKTWTGNGAWESSSNWVPSGMPGTFDQVTVQSGTLVFGNARTVKSMIVSNGASLLFTNWTTRLTASNVTVQSGGRIALPPAFTDSQMSNRIHIVCTNLTLETNAVIEAAGLGYKGGVASSESGSGPGKGLAGTGYYGGGGAHGGGGGDGTAGAGGVAYDATNAPGAPGSGGGGDTAGAGGGAVRIDAANAVAIHGTITADGANSANSYGGGGAGGSIWISCATLSGLTNGLLTARGGNGKDYINQGAGGGGAGGRIAVLYGSVQPGTGVRFSVAPGLRTSTLFPVVESGDPGTLYLPDAALLSETMASFLNVRLYGVTNWAADRLALTNRTVMFGENGFVLTITNDVVCDTNAAFAMPPLSALNAGGNLILTNGGTFTVYGGITNTLTPAYGALVSVAGNMTLATGSWVYCGATYSQNAPAQPPPVTNKAVAAPLFRMNNLAIAAGSGFNANEKGFSGGQPNTGQNGFGAAPGLSVGYYGGGAGHGGAGGAGSQGAGGSACDRTNAPILPGSGGGSDKGTPGGGAVRIEAAGLATLAGTLTANAGQGTLYNYGGGGAGGSIFLTCRQLSSTAGATLSANGGGSGLAGATPNGGGGGGGRIAVWVGSASDAQRAVLSADGSAPRVTVGATHPRFSGTTSVLYGTNTYAPSRSGSSGTVVFVNIPSPLGTVISVY
jgi:hypothetical protein